jgi:hypothetical protein
VKRFKLFVRGCIAAVSREAYRQEAASLSAEACLAAASLASRSARTAVGFSFVTTFTFYSSSMLLAVPLSGSHR